MNSNEYRIQRKERVDRTTRPFVELRSEVL